MNLRDSCRREAIRPFLPHAFSQRLSRSFICRGVAGCCLVGWCREVVLLCGLHIPSLIYAIVIEIRALAALPPNADGTWLETRAGVEPGHGPFLLHVLDATVYPDWPDWLVIGGAVLVCAGILGVYLRRYLRWAPSGKR